MIRNISAVIFAFVLHLGFSASWAAETQVVQQPSNVEIFPVKRKPLDPAAVQRAQAKFAHALLVAGRFTASAKAKDFAENGWKYAFVGNLMKIDESLFGQVESASDLTAAIGQSFALRERSARGAQAKSLNSMTYDLVFVPIDPCRIVDTRVGGGVIPAGSTRTFAYAQLNGSGASCSVTSQIPSGGPGDGVPAAEAVNVTVDETSLTGFTPGAFLAIFPEGGSLGTSFMNFAPNQIIANAGVIPINQSNGQFTVQVSAPANVIVDVFGLFLEPEPTALSCARVHSNFTATANSVTVGMGGTCPIGWTYTGQGCYSSPTDPFVFTQTTSVYATTPTTGYQGGVGQSYCSAKNTTAVDINMGQDTFCCQVPGRY